MDVQRNPKYGCKTSVDLRHGRYRYRGAMRQVGRVSWPTPVRPVRYTIMICQLVMLYPWQLANPSPGRS